MFETSAVVVDLMVGAGGNVSTDIKGNITVIPASLRPNASSLTSTLDFDNRLPSATTDSTTVSTEHDALFGEEDSLDDAASEIRNQAFIFGIIGTLQQKASWGAKAVIDGTLSAEKDSVHFDMGAESTISAQREVKFEIDIPLKKPISGTLGANTGSTRSKSSGRQADIQCICKDDYKANN